MPTSAARTWPISSSLMVWAHARIDALDHVASEPPQHSRGVLHALQRNTRIDVATAQENMRPASEPSYAPCVLRPDEARAQANDGAVAPRVEGRELQSRLARSRARPAALRRTLGRRVPRQAFRQLADRSERAAAVARTRTQGTSRDTSSHRALAGREVGHVGLFKHLGQPQHSPALLSAEAPRPWRKLSWPPWRAQARRQPSRHRLTLSCGNLQRPQDGLQLLPLRRLPGAQGCSGN
jgi:hypothetical protein